ncbi:hypothetical protein ABZ912_05245 [Nonomuraea angiospora]|uniref:hypothetical protein n=1 Tax=Nonomuraea angiospora TaxID=46172 RepID=UPI0033FA666C
MATPTKPNAEQIKAALATVLGWFTVMADGTARPAVLLPTGKVNSEDSANSPARLAWRCNGARVPLAGMLAAIKRGWDASPKSWPVLRDVTPATLVDEGTKLYGLDSEHPAASWDAVTEQSDRAIIGALFLAIRATDTAPFDVISELLAPATEEKASKLPDEQRELVNAVMNLSDTNPARAALMGALTDEGRAEVERRTKAKTEKAARRKAAKDDADAKAKEEAEAKPDAKPDAKATPKK